MKTAMLSETAIVLFLMAYLEHGAAIKVHGQVTQRGSSQVRFQCSFPAGAALGRSITLKRRTYTDSQYRLLSYTNSSATVNIMPGLTSLSGFRMNGAAFFTLQRARCQDAGLYMCVTLFSCSLTYNDMDSLTEVASVDLNPGQVTMTYQPKLLDFDHMVPGTLMNLQCSCYTTLFVQNNWVWETRLLPNETWAAVSNALRVDDKAPAITDRCRLPWRSTLTLAVSAVDVNREHRCYLQYSKASTLYNSSCAYFLFRDHQMSGSGNGLLLTILALTFGSGIIVLGSVLIFRTCSEQTRQTCLWTLHRLRCRGPPCNHYLHLHRRRFSTAASRGLGGERTSPSASGAENGTPEGGRRSRGGGEPGYPEIFSPRPARFGRLDLRGTDPKGGAGTSGSQHSLKRDHPSDDDSPGAEDQGIEEEMAFIDEECEQGGPKPKAVPSTSSSPLQSAANLDLCRPDMPASATGLEHGRGCGHCLCSETVTKCVRPHSPSLATIERYRESVTDSRYISNKEVTRQADQNTVFPSTIKSLSVRRTTDSQSLVSANSVTLQEITEACPAVSADAARNKQCGERPTSLMAVRGRDVESFLRPEPNLSSSAITRKATLSTLDKNQLSLSLIVDKASRCENTNTAQTGTTTGKSVGGQACPTTAVTEVSSNVSCPIADCVSASTPSPGAGYLSATASSQRVRPSNM